MIYASPMYATIQLFGPGGDFSQSDEEVQHWKGEERVDLNVYHN